MDIYKLIFFVDDEHILDESFINECKLFSNFSIIITDVNSHEHYFDKIRFNAKAGHLCITDEHGLKIVSLNYPKSFFDLKTQMHILGYFKIADDIKWDLA